MTNLTPEQDKRKFKRTVEFLAGESPKLEESRNWEFADARAKRRFRRLEKRCEWLEARILIAKYDGRHTGAVQRDTAELSALKWALGRIATDSRLAHVARESKPQLAGGTTE